VNRVVAAGAVQCDIGQQPVLRVRLAIEPKPDLVAHAAVRAIAADDIASAHLDLPARDVPERGVDGVAQLGQADELDALLDGAAEFLHAGAAGFRSGSSGGAARSRSPDGLSTRLGDWTATLERPVLDEDAERRSAPRVPK